VTLSRETGKSRKKNKFPHVLLIKSSKEQDIGKTKRKRSAFTIRLDKKEELSVRPTSKSKRTQRERKIKASEKL